MGTSKEVRTFLKWACGHLPDMGTSKVEEDRAQMNADDYRHVVSNAQPEEQRKKAADEDAVHDERRVASMHSVAQVVQRITHLSGRQHP